MSFSGSVLAISFPGGGDMIWESGGNEFFRYADQDASRFGNNDHPVKLGADEIAMALKSLTLQGEDGEPVFAVEQAELLGRYLAAGLSSARPDQDVIFALEKRVDRPFSMKPAELFVAGRAFYQDNKLNIIVGDYDRRRNEAYELVYDPTRTGIVRYDFDHGKRSKSSRAFRKKSVATQAGVENKRVNNGAPRNDWLVIDVKTASQASERLARTRQSAPSAVAPSAPRAVGITWGELEEGLESLNRLRQKGLITDQDYEAKKSEMLDALGPW